MAEHADVSAATRPYTRPMTPQVRRLLLTIIAMLGLVLIRRRPVRSPEPTGDWHPVDR
jgi:hypothetical protein